MDTWFSRGRENGGRRGLAPPATLHALNTVSHSRSLPLPPPGYETTFDEAGEVHEQQFGTEEYTYLPITSIHNDIWTCKNQGYLEMQSLVKRILHSTSSIFLSTLPSQTAGDK